VTRPAAHRRLDDGDIGVWCHYDDRHLVKEIPGARWDPDLRCWRVPPAFAREARAVVELLTRADVEANVESAAQRLLAVLPADLRPPTWRALAHAWHPDHGGDPRAMRALLALRGAA